MDTFFRMSKLWVKILIVVSYINARIQIWHHVDYVQHTGREMSTVMHNNPHPFHSAFANSPSSGARGAAEYPSISTHPCYPILSEYGGAEFDYVVAKPQNDDCWWQHFRPGPSPVWCPARNSAGTIIVFAIHQRPTIIRGSRNISTPLRGWLLNLPIYRDHPESDTIPRRSGCTT